MLGSEKPSRRVATRVGGSGFPSGQSRTALAGRSCTNKGLARGAAPADQPGVDDIPFVPPSGLKVNERRLFVLKLKEEFERVPAGCLVRIDGLGLKPPVPLPDHQSPGVLLLHPAGPNLS